MGKYHIQQDIEFCISYGRKVGEFEMPLYDPVFAFADIFFFVEEGKDPGGFIDVVVYIGSGFYQNIYVGGQPCRLFQNQHQAGSTFEAERHSDTFDRFQQAEGIQGPLNQARIGDVFLLQFPDVIKLVNSFVDYLSSFRTMRVSS
jgi:hypothetical protein